MSVQQLSFDPAQGQQTLASLTRPAVSAAGAGVSGLRFGDDRAHALLQTLPMFRHQADGFTAQDLRAAVGELRHQPVTAGQATYDLRRLRVHGLIARRPGTRRYDVTDQGLQQALFITHVSDRILQTVLAQLAEPTPNHLNTANRNYAKTIDRLTTHPT